MPKTIMNGGKSEHGQKSKRLGPLKQSSKLIDVQLTEDLSDSLRELKVRLLLPLHDALKFVPVCQIHFVCSSMLC